MPSFEFVLQRLIFKRNCMEAFPCNLHSLLNGQRKLTGLAIPITDTPITIAHHGQCCKTELAAAFYNLCNAVYSNKFFLKFFDCFHLNSSELKTQTSLSSCISQRFNAAVKLKTRTIKGHALNTFFFCALGY